MTRKITINEPKKFVNKPKYGKNLLPIEEVRNDR